MTSTSSQIQPEAQFCPFCGQRNAMAAISCVRCGELQPHADVGTVQSRSGRSASHSSSLSSATRVHNSGAVPHRRASAGIPSARPSHHGKTQYMDMSGFEQQLQNVSGSSMQGHVKLVVQQGLIIGEQYLLADDETHIGRHDVGSNYCPDIELSAQDPSYVHRRHAKLYFSPNGNTLTVKDLGGRNGVFVNNTGLGRFGETEIQVGDKIRIGRVVLKLLEA